MRPIGLVLAMLIASAPVMAQGWKEYRYPSYSFGVSFPAEPTVETKTYSAVDGSEAEARVYSVTQPNSILRMTIVEFSGKEMEEQAVIDHAIKTLTGDGEGEAEHPAPHQPGLWPPAQHHGARRQS